MCRRLVMSSGLLSSSIRYCIIVIVNQTAWIARPIKCIVIYLYIGSIKSTRYSQIKRKPCFVQGRRPTTRESVWRGAMRLTWNCPSTTMNQRAPQNGTPRRPCPSTRTTYRQKTTSSTCSTSGHLSTDQVRFDRLSTRCRNQLQLCDLDISAHAVRSRFKLDCSLCATLIEDELKESASGLPTVSVKLVTVLYFTLLWRQCREFKSDTTMFNG